MSSVGSFDDWEAEDEPEEEERQLEAEGAALAFVPQSARDGVGTGEAKRVRRTRMVLLGLACSMSIGRCVPVLIQAVCSTRLVLACFQCCTAGA